MLKVTSTIGGIVLLVWMFGGLAAPRVHALQTPPATKPTPQKPEPGATTRLRDGWITMKIHSQFIPENALDNSNIDVDTTSGVVTLSGTVATEAGRARAVAIAKATDGVKSVNDKLRIAPEGDKVSGATAAAKSGGRRVTDGWIKSKIYAQFLTENALEDSDIDVDVRTGVVTLNGTVPTEAGRGRAVAVAKATDGVKSVKDALKVVKR